MSTATRPLPWWWPRPKRRKAKAPPAPKPDFLADWPDHLIFSPERVAADEAAALPPPPPSGGHAAPDQARGDPDTPAPVIVQQLHNIRGDWRNPPAPDQAAADTTPPKGGGSLQRVGNIVFHRGAVPPTHYPSVRTIPTRPSGE